MANQEKSLFDIVIKWQKALLVIGLLAVVLSAIFSSSWFITPLYKSTAVLYPANIIPFGSESETEQMIQVLQSDAISDSLINIFQLYKHYGIDSTTDPFHRTHLLEQFHDNVLVKKTEYESVQIDILDKDPKVASEMAGSMIRLFDAKEQQLQKQKATEKYIVVKNQLTRLQTEMDSMELIVQGMRTDDGLLDYSLQTEYAMRNYLKSVSERGSGKNLEAFLEKLKSKGGKFLIITENLWRMRSQYADLKEKHDEALKEVNKKLTYSNVVVKPFAADKKSYPVRWLIVVTTLISSWLLSIIVISALENYRQNAHE
ncbi:MAG: hypothetical protein K1X82_02455 [Bacteroidia bacterium]|nr:hypothetical protein [Bacteroidia bacterium]